MPRFAPTQNNFSGGEWAPSLYGRTDQKKYSSACRLIRNWIVQPHGGASTRPGTYYAAHLVDEDNTAYLVPFQFSATDNYVLAFGDQTMNVIKGYDFVRYGVANVFETAIDNMEAIRGDGGIDIECGEYVSAGGQRLYVEGTHNAAVMDIDVSSSNKLYISHDGSTTGNYSYSECPPTLVFKVSGDFDIASRVKFDTVPSTPHTGYIGLQIRSTDKPLGYHSVLAIQLQAAGTFAIVTAELDEDDTVQNSASAATTNVEHWLRIKRVGTTITFYYSTSLTDPPASWTTLATGSRPWYADDIDFGFVLANQTGAGTGTFTGEFGEIDEVTATYGEPYSVTTPWLIADIPTLKYSQTADTMYLTHPDYAPRKLTRSADNSWTLSTVTFGTAQTSPTALSASISGITQADPGVVTTSAAHGFTTGAVITFSSVGGMTELNGKKYYIQVNDATTFHLHDLGTGANINTTAYTAYTSGGTVQAALANLDGKAISGITKANPGVITTSVNHGLTTGFIVTFENILGMTELNGNRYLAQVDSDTTFHLHALDTGANVDTTSYTTYTSGGYVRLANHRFVVTAFSATGEESLPCTACYASTNCVIQWTNATSAAWYSVYKDTGGTQGFYGWIADVYPTTTTTKYLIQNIDPDWETTPPENAGVFASTGNYPGSCTFFEQRMVYARTDNYPQTIWGSCIGRYDNFNSSHSLRDDEAYEFTLDSRQQNEILWLLALDRLLIGTAGNEWRMDGGSSSDTITPTAVNVRVQSQWGCHDIMPIVIGDTVLYVQYGGRNIRELAYSLEADRFVGNDITILANHLFKTRTIIDWAYQRMPRSVVWCVMSDGTLLGFTYLKEQQVWAWHQHQTDGTFESCCVIPDGSGNDILYLLVNRSIDGRTRRYIEVMQDIETVDITDAFCVDSGLTYDSTATATVHGLHHLEGETVVALADGFVYTGLTVADGSVTLPASASTIQVGLSYTCDLETLDFAPTSETDTVADRPRRIVSTQILFEASAYLSVGPDSSHLQEIVFRQDEGLDEVVPLYTGDKPLDPKSGEPDQSRLWLRVDKPLPCTVLSIVARMDVGGK